MANLDEAYKITVIGNEGGLNPGMGEAFTYRGVDESQNPHWDQWLYIHQAWDANKHLGIGAVNKILAADANLQSNIKEFYRDNYWNTLLLDQINDQQCANILFDDSVNPCEINAAHAMQTAVVACGVSLVVDGKIGSKTIAAVNLIKPITYYNAVVAIRKFHYNDEVVKNPKQRQWLANWLSRLIPYKTT